MLAVEAGKNPKDFNVLSRRRTSGLTSPYETFCENAGVAGNGLG